MQQEIQNPQFQTLIITITLFLGILFTLRHKSKDDPIFPPNLTQEIKGFAILTILFGHIGYFLDSKDTFLYPLSIASGIGVNLFLFLSGFGLTLSSLKKKLPLFTFYKKRLLRLFIPMWIVIAVLLILDWSILGLSYDSKLITKNIFGFYPEADIYSALNSVLWYFTFILFYYIVYSFCTLSKRLLLFSPLIIYLASYFVLKLDLPINKDVLTLYRLHIYAFPLGIFSALVPTYAKLIPNMSNLLTNTTQWLKNHNVIINILLLALFVYIFIYTSLHSGIGEGERREQIISMISTVSIILFFLLKRFKTKFLEILGIFSYEIYLLHWPLVYRYDFLYKYMPAGIATLLYIIILVGIGFVLQKGAEKIALKLKV